ncbi:MAG: alpha-2-macroglobulin family protein [Paludibacter sp.]|nr:alpha-2-macroglobulin family protein [Paludibacter sp.]
MKKNLFVALLTTLVFVSLLVAQKSNTPLETRWKTVDEFATKQLPESALKEVEAILTQAQKEKNSVQVIKAMVYKMRFTLDKNPDEAPSLIREFETFTNKSTDPAERALLHSMTAELYAQFYQKDQYTINNRTVLKGFVPEDMKEWTKNIYFDKINKLLAASMDNAEVLQHTDALKFAELLQKGEDSRIIQPTLFDFLGYRRIQILQTIFNATNVKNPLNHPELFAGISQFINLKPDTIYQNSIENPILETYRQLLSFELANKNILSVVYTELQCLRYLNQHADIEGKDSLYLSALYNLKKQYFDNEAVIEVYGEIANYYIEHVYLDTKKGYKKMAFDLCTEGIKRFPTYRRIDMLKNMKHTITQKNLYITNEHVVIPANDLKIKINSTNITLLKLSVYKLNATAREYNSFKQNNGNAKKAYSNHSLIETRTITIKPDENFDPISTTITIHTGDYGLYEYTLEETGPEKNIEAVLGSYTVSSLAFMIRTNKPDVVDFYVLDRMTGKPQTEVNVTKFVSKWKSGAGYEMEQEVQIKTDKTGLGKFSYNANDYSNYVLFLEKGKDRYLSSNAYTNYYNRNRVENRDAKLNLFTDRSLYRPGQTVYFKGIAYYSNSKQQNIIEGSDYEVTLFDANNQQVSLKKFKTNDFGSFQGSFELPGQGLNGRYQLRSGLTVQNIWVEEYKRPTFEVKMDKPKTEVSFGEKVTLTGTVKAYAGNLIGDAKIKYRVVRRTHRYCWWFNEPDKEITNGTTVSKADGTFTVSFIPEKTHNEAVSIRGQFYTYTVYAAVTDQKGETQKGEQSMSVGEKSLFIITYIPAKTDKDQAFNIDVRTETLNGEKVNSNITYTLYRLPETDQYAEDIEEEEADKHAADLKLAKKVMTGTFDSRDEKLKLELKKQESGRYELQLKTTDAHGKEVVTEKTFVIFSLNDKKLPLKSHTWLMTSGTEYETGETARVHFGTSTVNASVLYEVMSGNNVLESRWIPFSNEIKTIDIPFKENYGAGVIVLFTFMTDGQLYTQNIQLSRKKTVKKLTPTLSVFRNKLLPGEKAEWTVSIPESSNSKKAAEILVGMYDASLDALRKHTWYFNPAYQETILNSPGWIANAVRTVSDNSSFRMPDKAIQEFYLNQLNWFGLNITNSGPIRIRGVGQMMNISDVRQVVTQEEKTGLNEVVVVGYGTMKKMDVTGSVSRVEIAPQGKVQPEIIENVPVQFRTNFNETAFFYPQLRTDEKGNVTFTFTAPESLTRWNVKMLAHTKDLYFGQGEGQVVTQKDLMVQMNLSRFVRRSDRLVLSASVVNLTDKEQTASVQFELIDPATEKLITLKDAAPKSVLLKANETKAVEWEVSEFSPYELVTCKVTARAGNFSDGEQKYLPVLPDKVLVTESMPLTIRGNQTRTFNFESLLKNGSKVDTKSLTVEFASNPSWYAVQALPTLAAPENDNAIDYFAAYYVNSLAGFIANSNPTIATTFDRWKKAGGSREALLSNLEKNTELKNMLLEETPWVMAAKDETEQKRQIALLFDLNMQKNQAKQYLDKLISLQLPSGGFSWYKNMPESRYITQEIMLNLGRLKRMTAGSTPDALSSTLNAQPSILKAISYLDLEISHDFINLKKDNKNYDKEMSIGNMQLFYLHVRSEYPDIPLETAAREAVAFYTSQSEKYWTNLTLYGQAMMAVVAHRNGNTRVANDILKSLKENAMKNDEFGMYWTRNTAGYYWNEQPVAVQAAIISAFAEVTKNTADVDEMKLWLLKQKQTQRWNSPLATVDAIYALLQSGSDWLANSTQAKITLGNVLLQPQNVEAGTGYFKQTIPLAEIRPEMGRVTVSSTDVFTPSEAVSKGSEAVSKAGIGWGAMYWQYYQDLDKVTGQSGPLKITRKLFVEKMSPDGKTIVPIEQSVLTKGDKVITRLVITTDRNLEFVALKDLRAACFEPVNQLSESKWKEGVCYYQTIKDATTQFFFSYLPKGTYVFEYEVWVNSTGNYTSGIASLQCQYAPEFVSHTGGERIEIK